VALADVPLVDDLAYPVAYQVVAYSFLVVEGHQVLEGHLGEEDHFEVLEGHQVVVVVHQVYVVHFVVSFPSSGVGSC